METEIKSSGRRRAEAWAGVASCGGVAIGWGLQRLVSDQPDYGQGFLPQWLALVAAVIAAAGLIPLGGASFRAQPALRWAGLLLMVWAANGLPFDLFAAAGLLGHKTASGEIVLATAYWPGLVTRAFALGATTVLAHLALARPAASAPLRAPVWFGYAAFLCALPYPLLRTHWAFGGTIGLTTAGAAGQGFEPMLLAIPWAMAAALSLALVRPPQWISRRLLLLAGWTATAIVATIGPAAFWSLLSTLASGGDAATGGIELWVFVLFYGSWFFFAIAEGAATRSYQLRSAVGG